MKKVLHMTLDEINGYYTKGDIHLCTEGLYKVFPHLEGVKKIFICASSTRSHVKGERTLTLEDGSFCNYRRRRIFLLYWVADYIRENFGDVKIYVMAFPANSVPKVVTPKPINPIRNIVKDANPVVARPDKNPLVEFDYPNSRAKWELIHRRVRMIAADRGYLIGIEVSDKNRFKKFLKSKIRNLNIIEFNPTGIE